MSGSELHKNHNFRVIAFCFYTCNMVQFTYTFHLNFFTAHQSTKTCSTGDINSMNLLVNEWFLKIILAHCGSARPVVLLLDNHDSHVTSEVVQTAMDNGVDLLGLSSYTSCKLPMSGEHLIRNHEKHICLLITCILHVYSLCFVF